MYPPDTFEWFITEHIGVIRRRRWLRDASIVFHFKSTNPNCTPRIVAAVCCGSSKENKCRENLNSAPVKIQLPWENLAASRESGSKPDAVVSRSTSRCADNGDSILSYFPRICEYVCAYQSHPCVLPRISSRILLQRFLITKCRCWLRKRLKCEKWNANM